MIVAAGLIIGLAGLVVIVAWVAWPKVADLFEDVPDEEHP